MSGYFGMPIKYDRPLTPDQIFIGAIYNFFPLIQFAQNIQIDPQGIYSKLLQPWMPVLTRSTGVMQLHESTLAALEICKISHPTCSI